VLRLVFNVYFWEKKKLAKRYGHFKGCKWGHLFFMTERYCHKNSCYGNKTKGFILFLLWCTFVVPSLNNTALIFPEIFLPFFSCRSYDVITDLICIIDKCQYLWNEKRYFKKETPFFCISKCLSNKQKKFMSYTLTHIQSLQPCAFSPLFCNFGTDTGSESLSF